MTMDPIRAEIGPLKFSIKPSHAERTPLTTKWMGEMEKAAKSTRHGWVVRHLQTGGMGLACLVTMNIDSLIELFVAIGKVFEGIGKGFEGRSDKFEQCMEDSVHHAWLAIKYDFMAGVTAVGSFFIPETIVRWNRDLGLAPAPKPIDVLTSVGESLGLQGLMGRA